MKLSLVEAFGKFGAKPANRQRGLSAIAADGAMVLSCSMGHFAHPRRGVLRYEDRISRDPDDPANAALLGEHLALARDQQLPVRMIVSSIVESGNGRHSRSFYVRPDLVGRVVSFDGDHFIIDFTRLEGLPAIRRSR